MYELIISNWNVKIFIYFINCTHCKQEKSCLKFIKNTSNFSENKNWIGDKV